MKTSFKLAPLVVGRTRSNLRTYQLHGGVMKLACTRAVLVLISVAIFIGATAAIGLGSPGSGVQASQTSESIRIKFSTGIRSSSKR